MSEPEDESTLADAVGDSGASPPPVEATEAPPAEAPVVVVEPPASAVPSVPPAPVAPVSSGSSSKAAESRDIDVLGADGKASDDQDDDPQDDDDYDDDDWDETAARDAQATRWVSMVTAVGIGIVAVVGLQVLMSLVEGLSLRAGERFSTTELPVADDLLHRLGYPFGGLGATAQLFLVAGVVLISLPPILGGRLTAGQYRATGIALRVATALAIIVAIGSLLAVRGSLHEYTAKNFPVPPFVRVQFTNFLLGTLAGAALAVFCSITAHPLRDWEK